MTMERRRYFRIDETLQLTVHLLSEEELESGELPVPEEQVGDLLGNIDKQIQGIIDAARIQAPAIANLAELINRKLNMVITALDLTSNISERISYSTQQVNLSACGIAFRTPDSLNVSDQVWLGLLLEPEDLELKLIARVISCEEIAGDSPAKEYMLRLNFHGISNVDQEILIQHIIRRQGLELKRQRVKREEQQNSEPQ